ncbi:hypothetical protein [Cronobacter sakazakii]|uniref:hypothetical protein n=1 Tax=Cronobacter sakazakii TaxID=28141 RepID=UPI0027B822BA|nr:hypothetical protein [Cronobacter sakazakii]MDQ1980271.1 hypothetical protein [Cronobacter sakazakii]
MNRMTGITVLCLALMGCSSVTSENGTQYLKTEMQSSVSGPTTVTVTADSLLKKANDRHLILYALRPLPGKAFSSELDRKFAAATMYIDLSSGSGIDDRERRAPRHAPGRADCGFPHPCC